MITKHVYDGKPFVKPQKKKVKEGPSLYEKVRMGKKRRVFPDFDPPSRELTTDFPEFQVKTRYDMILSDMSEAKHVDRGGKWNGTFFDTKVGQQDFFECVCGGYLPEDMDDKWVAAAKGASINDVHKILIPTLCPHFELIYNLEFTQPLTMSAFI